MREFYQHGELFSMDELYYFVENNATEVCKLTLSELDTILEYFTEIEEYEKCIKIKKLIDSYLKK